MRSFKALKKVKGAGGEVEYWLERSYGVSAVGLFAMSLFPVWEGRL